MLLTPEQATAEHRTEHALRRAELARFRRARRASLRARSTRRPAAPDRR
jgi:hypothetical protein